MRLPSSPRSSREDGDASVDAAAAAASPPPPPSRDPPLFFAEAQISRGQPASGSVQQRRRDDAGGAHPSSSCSSSPSPLQVFVPSPLPPSPPARSASPAPPRTQHLCILAAGVLVFHVLTSVLQECIFHLPGFSNVLLMSFGETACTTALMATHLTWVWWRGGGGGERRDDSAVDHHQHDTAGAMTRHARRRGVWRALSAYAVYWRRITGALRRIFHPSTVELHWYVRIALLLSCSLYLTNQTSILLSYPLQVVFKSSKLLCMVVVRRWWMRGDTDGGKRVSECDTDPDSVEQRAGHRQPRDGTSRRERGGGLAVRGWVDSRANTAVDERLRRCLPRRQTAKRDDEPAPRGECPSHHHAGVADLHGAQEDASIPSAMKTAAIAPTTPSVAAASLRDAAVRCPSKEWPGSEGSTAAPSPLSIPVTGSGSGGVVPLAEQQPRDHRRGSMYHVSQRQNDEDGGGNRDIEDGADGRGMTARNSRHSLLQSWLANAAVTRCSLLLALWMRRTLGMLTRLLLCCCGCSSFARRERPPPPHPLRRLRALLLGTRLTTPFSLSPSRTARTALRGLRGLAKDGELQACTVIVVGLIIFTYASKLDGGAAVSAVAQNEDDLNGGGGGAMLLLLRRSAVPAELINSTDNAADAPRTGVGLNAVQHPTTVLPEQPSPPPSPSPLSSQPQSVNSTLASFAVSAEPHSSAWRTMTDLYTVWIVSSIGVAGVLLSNLMDVVIYVLEEVYCFQTAGSTAWTSPPSVPTLPSSMEVSTDTALRGRQHPRQQHHHNYATSSSCAAPPPPPASSHQTDAAVEVNAESTAPHSAQAAAAAASQRVPATSQEVLFMLNGLASIFYSLGLALPWLSEYAAGGTCSLAPLTAPNTTTLPFLSFTMLIILVAVTSLIGTMCLLTIVAEYTGVTAVIVTSVRKTATVLLSFVLYGRRFTSAHAIGLAGVMGGVVWNELLRRQHAAATA
ncbi:hypothetical protein ABB37_08913 [Leptomonas pyrrhocoris]|uniref:Uncharacterized protein n=1 Tax=Leptomonas pyrrhocoris TaxID=157538 RepID=A0A0M9FSF9_LEPPY|nr:hypothetical protein ABB37_08913 [Leptomonas pyrrhocoris]KPA74926.1 hypothetical protein ABB37_08913 [Leptomonas pyrrhocoris]|eukprot:XP_015653365.1 hypothetical protein ABB37_08913 [Leptomonas pyrrhocoris]